LHINTKKKQAEAVNRKRSHYTKPLLDCGDIVSIQVPPQSRGACDHPWLPVMVTQIIMKKNKEAQYEVCSKHGILEGIFPRNQLYHNQYLTAELLGINEAQARSKTKLSVAKASAMYNTLGGRNVCRCKSDCSKNSRCSCIMLGRFCVKKYHLRRSDGTKIKCRNCAPTKHN
jgi:hypothetical protein